jgi:DNA gyrase/topoisomerase IV subunit B
MVARMKDRGWIEPIIERVVSEVLDSHVARLRTEIVQRVIEEIAVAAPKEAETSSQSAGGAAELARAVSEIQLGTSQKEILRALLDCSSRYASRVALFVVKGTHATGWQARGFSNSDGIKDFALDDHASAVSSAIVDRIATKAGTGQMDGKFLGEFGAPANGDGQMYPLMLKEKVAALIYADGGTEASGQLDAGSIELLVLATGSWLEVNSLRKTAQKEPSAVGETQAAPVASAAPAQQFNDPFAAHSPAFTAGKAMAAAASAAPAASIEIEAPAPSAESTIPVAAPAMSPEDEDTHRKAHRFARLLVDEIKLYNQAKVAEGRKNKDLYDRLKEPIEKSRGTYQKRYGTTAAASADYFHHEIIRSLAEDDPSVMGANFR